MLLATGCSSTVIVPGEDGAAAEIVAEDAGVDSTDPCATCAHTEWFCADFICGTNPGNCYICQTAACQMPGCTVTGLAEGTYPTWCCP